MKRRTFLTQAEENTASFSAKFLTGFREELKQEKLIAANATLPK